MEKVGELILCNRCGKKFAVKGIRGKRKEREEYRVDYFSCPHCGADYQILTTDKELRSIMEQREQAMRQCKFAIRRGFRQKTAQEHLRQADRLREKIKKRAAELRAVGEEILNGGSDDGSENSDRGTEGLQVH